MRLCVIERNDSAFRIAGDRHFHDVEQFIDAVNHDRARRRLESIDPLIEL